MNHTRRAFLEGLSETGLVAAFPTAAVTAAPALPDFGPNVFIVAPDMPAEVVQTGVDTILHEQERAHFTDTRHVILFKPGHCSVNVNVGLFTQVVGLGGLPGNVATDGHVHAEADRAKGMALVNFWQGVGNLSVRPADGADRWPVSQAAPDRRVHLHGDLALDDLCELYHRPLDRTEQRDRGTAQTRSPVYQSHDDLARYRPGDDRASGQRFWRRRATGRGSPDADTPSMTKRAIRCSC